MPAWPLRCLRYYWSYYFIASSRYLVCHHRCSSLVSFIPSVSCVLSCCLWFQILPILCTVWRPARFCLGPLLFIMYTAPLSCLISNSSVSHQMYADDTQLYLSFSPLSFASNIAQLQSVMPRCHLGCRPTSNHSILTKLNSWSLVLHSLLSKLNDPKLILNSDTITPVTSARNLCIVFDNQLCLRIRSHSHHCHNRVSTTFTTCVAFANSNTLDFIRACTIGTSLVHSIHDYCNSL